MRWISTLIILLMTTTVYANKSDVFRKNLAIAPTDKNVCLEMIDMLRQNSSNHKLLGYLGAYTMIKANHQINPFNKLSSFKRGKSILEKAIKSLPTDVELRYVRYAIQSSIPSFLGYDQNLKEDKEILESEFKNCPPNFQTDILKLIKLKATKKYE